MDRTHAGRNITIETDRRNRKGIEREFEKELKNIEDKSVKEKAGEAGF